MLDWLAQAGFSDAGSAWALLTLGAAAGLSLVALPLWLVLAGRIRSWRAFSQELEIKLEAEQRISEERDRAFLEARRQLSAAFENLSGHALRQASRDFLQLAEQNLKSYQSAADTDFKERQRAIADLLKPIEQLMGKTQQQITELENDRRLTQGALQQHLKSVTEAQRSLQLETKNLANALRRPEVRGRWGEMTLRRLVELAGMVERCDFTEQVSTAKEGNALRPDMVIQLPDDREVVVDVKTPLDAYLAAHEAASDADRQKQLKRHARIVAERVGELSAKAYWEQFDKSADFVVMFIPGEQFLTAALDIRPDLLEKALAGKVILATPTSFIGLLKAIAFSWRQLELIENAQSIRNLGETFYRRVATFSEHLSRMGKALNQAVGHFNAAAGSLERQVLPATRRLMEMGITSSRSVENIDTVDKATREVSFPSPVEPVKQEDSEPPT